MADIKNKIIEDVGIKASTKQTIPSKGNDKINENVKLGFIIENGGFIVRHVELGCAWVIINPNDHIIWNVTCNPYKLTGKDKILILSSTHNGTNVKFINIDKPEVKQGTLITSFNVDDNSMKLHKFTKKIFGNNRDELKSFCISFAEINKSIK